MEKINIKKHDSNGSKITDSYLDEWVSIRAGLDDNLKKIKPFRQIIEEQQINELFDTVVKMDKNSAPLEVNFCGVKHIFVVDGDELKWGEVKPR